MQSSSDSIEHYQWISFSDGVVKCWKGISKKDVPEWFYDQRGKLLMKFIADGRISGRADKRTGETMSNEE